MKNYSGLIRFVLTLVQAVIDTALFWVVFSIFSFSPVFTFEVKVFLTGTMLAVFYFNSLYGFRNWVLWDELKLVLKSAALILLVIVLYLYSQKSCIPIFTLSAGILIFVLLCMVMRYVFRRLIFSCGLLANHIIVFGAGKTGEMFAKTILKHPFSMCRITGFLDDDENKHGKLIDGIPVLGKFDDFSRVRTEHRIDEAAVAVSSASRSLLANILDITDFQVRRVHYIPDMYMLNTFSASMTDVDGMPVISASNSLGNPISRFFKCIMDYTGGLIALILLSPLMLYIAFRVKHEDNGTIFFKHKRIGRNLKLFYIYKFRSMIPNAEEVLKEMMKDENLKKKFEESFKFKEDPRQTVIGQRLRHTSLDELPQLFNVLKGEMSLVGPRPVVRKEIRMYYGYKAAHKIFHVTPGMTGLWQVNGRSDISYDLRKDIDMYYVRNWSLWFDFVILIRTVYVVLSRQGAY